MESVKLQKYFSDCGVMSRRAAEEEIKMGRVKVNGSVAELGLRIDPETDVVEYRGQRITRSGEEKICILLNKPRGFVTTLSDEKGRRTVAELVASVGRRVYPVGRLDMDSDGLLLLTDDGELANRLTHPRHEIPKIYHVTVSGEVSVGDALAEVFAFKVAAPEGENAGEEEYIAASKEVYINSEMSEMIRLEFADSDMQRL